MCLNGQIGVSINNSTSAKAFVLLLSLGGAMAPAQSWAIESTESQNAANVTVIDLKGMPAPVKIQTASRWFWGPIEGQVPRIRPQLRIWLSAPKHGSVDVAASHVSMKPEVDAPPPPSAMNGTWMAQACSSPPCEGELTVEEKRYSIFVDPLSPVPNQVQAHKSCDDLGIKALLDLESGGPLPWAGITCSPVKDKKVSVTLEPFGKSTQVPFIEATQSITTPLGTIEFEADSRKRRLRLIHEKPVSELSRFTFVAGAQTTYLTYAEDPTATRLTEAALTLKGTAGYSWVPARWDAQLTGWFNLPPLGLSGTETSTALFYGINGRIGRLFPLGRGNWVLKPGLGIFAWAMHVSNSAFGVALLGPQFSLQLENAAGFQPRMFAYIKAAPVSGVTNGELSFGAGRGITRWRGRPLTVTLDVARTSYDEGAGGNRFRMFALSLGLSLVL
jgi:hypothetical protein